MAKQITKICVFCGNTFKGRRDAKTCSPTCRKRLQRHNSLKDKLLQETSIIEQAVKNEIGVVKDNLSFAPKLIPIEVTDSAEFSPQDSSSVDDLEDTSSIQNSSINSSPIEVKDTSVEEKINVSNSSKMGEETLYDLADKTLQSRKVDEPEENQDKYVKTSKFKRAIGLGALVVLLLISGLAFNFLFAKGNKTQITQLNSSQRAQAKEEAQDKLIINNKTTQLSLQVTELNKRISSLPITSNNNTSESIVVSGSDRSTTSAAYNGPNELVQLTPTGQIPALDGSNLTNVNATTLDGFSNDYFTNASNINSGTLSDNRLSSNVALLNGDNVFKPTTDSSSVFEVQNSSGNTIFNIDSTGNGQVTFDTATAFNGPVTFSNLPSSGNQAVCLNGFGILSTCSGGIGTPGVSSLDTKQGDLTIANTSVNGTTITIADASTTSKGIAEYDPAYFNATNGNISLNTNVTTQGNTFNGISQLVQTNSSGFLPALNGSLLTNLSAGNLTGTVGSGQLSGSYGNITGVGALTSGSIGDSFGNINIGGNTFTGNGSGLTNLPAGSLSGTLTNNQVTALNANITLQGNSFNGSSELVQTNSSGQLTALNGSLLTNLSGGNITAGSVANAALTNSSVTVTAGTNLTNGGTVALGGSITLNVANAPTFSGNLTVQGSGGVTVGSTSNTGLLSLLDGTNDGFKANLGLSGALSANQTYSLPSSGGTLCTASSCSYSGTAAGGDLSGNYPNPTIAKLQGTTLTISSIASGQILQYNGSALVNSLITSANLTSGNGFGNINIGTNTIAANGSLLTNLSGGNITAGSVANAALTNSSVTVTAGTNLTNGGTVALGGSITLNVANAPTFSGNLTVQGSGGVTVGSTSNTGLLSLLDGTNDGFKANLGLSGALSANQTYSLPSSGGTLCTASSCSYSGTAAGGDLSGNYPNPTIAKLQGTTLTISSIASGQILQYNGSALVNSLITSANLTSGNGFGNINIGTNTIAANGSLLTNLSGGNITAGSVANAALTNSSVTVTAGTNLTNGGTVALGGSITLNVANAPTFSGQITDTNTGTNSLLVQGNPLAGSGGATSSLVQFGPNTISGGNNTTTTGGTYLGINENATGGGLSGSTADFLDFQNGGTKELQVTSSGVVNENGALTINGGGETITAGGLTVNAGGSVIKSSASTETINGSGDSVQSATNSVTAFQVQGAANSDSTNLLTADTVNNKVAVQGQISVIGGINTSGLSGVNPSVNLGGSGTTSNVIYAYRVSSVNAAGNYTAASSSVSINPSYATLTSSAYNVISWTGVPGASSYYIYRVAAGGTPSSVGYVGTVSANSGVSNSYSFSDTGLTATTSSTSAYGAFSTLLPYPQYDTSGQLTVNNTALFQNTANSNVAVQIQNASGTSLLTADTTKNVIDIGTNGTSTSQFYVSGNLPTTSLSGLVLNSAQAVTTQGQYIYVADGCGTAGNSYLEVYSQSVTSSAPSLVGSDGTCTTTGQASSVSVNGNYAFVTYSGGSEGGEVLAAFNISNPANITLASKVVISSSYTITNYLAAYVQGRYAYVMVRTSNTVQTLFVYDVSSPSSGLTLVGSTTVTTGSTGQGIAKVGIYVQGQYVYVTDNLANSLYVFNVANPASPTKVGSISTGANTGPDSVYVQGSYAYVTLSATNFLAAYNISTPSSPTSAGTISTGSSSEPDSVYVQGREAYISLYQANKLESVDVSNPASMQLISSTNTGYSPYTDYVNGRYAYVLTANAGSLLNTYDIGGSYVQQLQSGGIETGTLQADGNANFNSDLGIAGGLSVGGSAQISGDLGVTGNLLIGGNFTISGTFTAATVNGTNGIYTGGTGTTNERIDGSGNLTNIGNITGSGAITIAATNTSSTGLVIQNSTNSTKDFQINNSTGTNLFVADTTNMELGIGGAPTVGGSNLQVTGTINASSALYINGTQICTSTGCAGSAAPSAGSTSYIQNGYSTQTNTNFNIQSSSDSIVTATLEAKDSSATADILDILNGSGTKVDTFDSNGDLKINSSQSTAFIVQTTGGTILFQINASTQAISVNANTTISGTSTAYSTLTLNDAHIKSTQDTAPTMFNLTNCGTSPGTPTLSAGSTDTAGQFSIPVGSGTIGSTNCSVSLVFSKQLSNLPQSILITPANANGISAGGGVAFESITAFTFQAQNKPTANQTMSFYYLVIGN